MVVKNASKRNTKPIFFLRNKRDIKKQKEKRKKEEKGDRERGIKRERDRE